MVDIAAQLSLTASGPAIDPVTILGAEIANSQAFGDILAGQVAGSVQAYTGTGAPATPLPPFPLPAGNRQPGGKILPGAEQTLPDVAPLSLEAPAPQVLPSMAALPAVRLVTTPSLTKLVPQPHTPVGLASETATDASAPEQVEASPVHGLIKMLAAALKGQRPATAHAPEDAPATAATADPETTNAGPDAPEQAIPAAAPALAALWFAPPILSAPAPTPVGVAPQAEASEAPRATSSRDAPLPARTPIPAAIPILVSVPTPTPSPSPSLPEEPAAAIREQIRPALRQFPVQLVEARPVQAQSPQAQPVLAQLVQVQPVQVQPVQVQSAQPPVSAPTEAPAVPVLTLVAAPRDAVAPTVTLVTAPALPVGQTPALPVGQTPALPAGQTPALPAGQTPALPAGQTIAARIKVAVSADQAASAVTAERPVAVQLPLVARDVAVETPVAAGRAVPAIRTVLAERAATDHTAAAAAADGQPPLAAAAPVASAPVAPTGNTGAPAVEMPRQDFAALVERLVEARNASAPQSTHAALNHAEFGQVSLHFQQDGGDLKVAMSSADPDFARAAQAAQAAQSTQPAERQSFTADNARGQSQSSPQNQSPSANSSSHHEAAGRGAERSDQQSRNSQGRNSRGGNNSSNPSPHWAGRDQPQVRGGIFA